MPSGSKKTPKPRPRFNFLSQGQKRRPAESARDEILDSLARHARSEDQSMQETGPTMNSAESTLTDEQNSLRDDLGQARGSRHPGRSAILIFLGGFLAAWSYGYITGAYSIPYISTFVQNQAVQVVIQTATANPLPAGIITTSMFLAILYALHRRKTPS